MIDFCPTDEEIAIRDSVRRFVEAELLPMENAVIQREIAGGLPRLSQEEVRALRT